MYLICLCCYIVEVQDVKQMATVTKHQQPTIAIITANYCEKLAVDAMMQDKTTFVKFKTNGRFNISQLMRFKTSRRQPKKALASHYVRDVAPKPPRVTFKKYGSR